MGLEVAGVEGGMGGDESPLQVQLLDYWSYALEDLEWAHPTWMQLFGAWQREVLGGKQHHVANLELLVAMVGIIVPLLIHLCLLYLLPSFLHDCLDLLGHFSHPHKHPSAHNNIT